MPTSQCAFAYDQCDAANPAQDHANADFLTSIGVDGALAKQMVRCSYCGGYWSRDGNGRKRRQGYVESGEWVPVRS